MIDPATLPALPEGCAWRSPYGTNAPGGDFDVHLDGYAIARVALRADGVTYLADVGRHRDPAARVARTFASLDRACAWIDAWIRMRGSAIRGEVAAKQAAFEKDHFARWGGGAGARAAKTTPTPDPPPRPWTASDEHARRGGRTRGRPGPRL